MNAIDEKTRDAAMLISSVLFRTTLLGFLLLGISSILVLGMTDAAYALHSNFIDVPRSEYNVMLFSWLGNMKMLLFVFFLLPAIAIRWALKNA